MIITINRTSNGIKSYSNVTNTIITKYTYTMYRSYEIIIIFTHDILSIVEQKND